MGKAKLARPYRPPLIGPCTANIIQVNFIRFTLNTFELYRLFSGQSSTISMYGHYEFLITENERCISKVKYSSKIQIIAHY